MAEGGRARLLEGGRFIEGGDDKVFLSTKKNKNHDFIHVHVKSKLTSFLCLNER